MAKFNVGDIVTINMSNADYWKAGDVGTVKGVDSGNIFRIDFNIKWSGSDSRGSDKNGTYWSAVEPWLELVNQRHDFGPIFWWRRRNEPWNIAYYANHQTEGANSKFLSEASKEEVLCTFSKWEKASPSPRTTFTHINPLTVGEQLQNKLRDEPQMIKDPVKTGVHPAPRKRLLLLN